MNSKILPFIFVFGMLCAAVCPCSFAKNASPDCDKALESCNESCRQNNTFDVVEKTDFETQCTNSCAKGFEICSAQNSREACPTFDIHCVSSCPWTVWGKSWGTQYSNVGSFGVCMNACGKGREACLEVNKKLPSRPRTGTFDLCEEAQAGCYANCADTTIDNEAESGDYMDLCAKACMQAVDSCKRETPAKRCNSYQKYCSQACPSEVHDSNGNPIPGNEFYDLCEGDCGAGALYCENMQKIKN